MSKVAYVKHPVSRERINILKRQGLQIIDARFMPEGEEVYKFDDAVDTLGTDSGDQFSDEQLREAIEKITGTAPHPAMKRENLIARYNKLNADDVNK